MQWLKSHGVNHSNQQPYGVKGLGLFRVRMGVSKNKGYRILGVHIIRILPSRVLYQGPLFWETPIWFCIKGLRLECKVFIYLQIKCFDSKVPIWELLLRPLYILPIAHSRRDFEAFVQVSEDHISS